MRRLYKPSQSKSRETQRRMHVDQRRPGSKARELEQIRKQAKEALPKSGELDFDPPRYQLEEVPLEEALKARPRPEEEKAEAKTSPVTLPQETLPFAQNHKGSASRYAGVVYSVFSTTDPMALVRQDLQPLWCSMADLYRLPVDEWTEHSLYRATQAHPPRGSGVCTGAWLTAIVTDDLGLVPQGGGQGGIRSPDNGAVR